MVTLIMPKVQDATILIIRLSQALIKLVGHWKWKKVQMSYIQTLLRLKMLTKTRQYHGRPRSQMAGYGIIME